MRTAVEFVGPVPVAEIETHARVLRAARSAALVEVSISAADRECLLARVWFVRDADTSSLTAPLGDSIAVPDVPSGLGHSFGYGASLEWRFVRGHLGEPGPAAAWVRPNTPLVDERDVPGLARVALVADSASGISAELDWARWSFLNVNLDVHLARPPEGDWLLLDAATQLGAHGCAMARSTLSDTRGIVGAGLQTLVVGPLSARK